LQVYLNVAAGSAKVFGYFVNLVSTFGTISRYKLSELTLI